jgi:hypothetical protein
MTCQNTGPLHLRISKEACENAGGQWFRRPCVTLKDAIDERPSRFELDVPRSGTCGDELRLLDVAYLTVENPQDLVPGPTIKRVKLQQTTGTWINIFELQIFDPTDQNIALSGTASASSAYSNGDTASKAIDGNMQTIYHSKNAQEGDPAPWLQIDLPASYEAHKIIIHNRGCGDEVKDQCLCRLSYANLLLYDESGAVVSSISTGDTCGIATLTYGPKDLLPCCGSCLSSALDQEVSKTAMHYCDMSMSLLLGSTTSLGSLRAIKDEVVSKGLDYLPGRCCFDKPTTQNAYFGVYVSSEMKQLVY